ncbi:hypothetical protein JCM8097_008725 [Rhodosporidiobolus ruineniae]
MASEPVRLLVANHKVLLWDLADIQKLRVEHHICGSLQGTLPQVTQQNVFLGLPLVLLPEEVVLLVRNKLAVLVSDPDAHLPPTAHQAADYASSRASAILAQQEASQANELERKKEWEVKNRDKIEQKRREKEEKRRKATEAAGGEGREGFEVFVPELKEGAQTTGAPSSAQPSSAQPSSSSSLPLAAPSAADLPPASSLPYQILIEPSSSAFAWYDPSSSAVTYPTLEAAKEAGVWSYPINTLQEARCRVFEDLWRRGFYMGGGLRFGGDFLVYPGDPLRYHSHFTLTVLSTPQTSILPLDLVAYGRLATAVKKAHLLASWDDEKGEAEYASLEWAAFG